MEQLAPRLIGIALWALLPGFIAKGKGRSFFGYYFLSFLISPLITTIITLCLSNLNESKGIDCLPGQVAECLKCGYQGMYGNSCPQCGGQRRRYVYPNKPNSAPVLKTIPTPTTPVPVSPSSTIPKDTQQNEPVERGNIPRYVLLSNTSSISDQTEYTFHFSAYDADFVRACAQAVIDGAKVVTKVLLLSPDMSDQNVLPDITAAGMKLQNCPNLAGEIHGLSVDTLTGKNRLMVTLRTGSSSINVLCSKGLPQDEITLLIDRVIHRSLSST